MDELWLKFTQTGKVDDYLKYRNETKEFSNADENKGLDNKGTDYRGE